MANLVDKAKNFVAEKVANMKKPEANLADVSVKGVSRDSAIFHGQVVVNNPYSHDLPIGEITYTLKSADRKGQEGKNMIEGGDYALQSEPEEVLHHSQMFYGNGGGMVGVNSRKTVEEAMNTTADTPVNLFHLQSQPSASTLINLAQLHNHHSPMVSTGLRKPKTEDKIENPKQTNDM